MPDVGDNELILFHYGDGLPPEQLREIERALTRSAALAERYRVLRRLLAEMDRDSPPQPDEEFENRLWRQLRPQLDAPDAGLAAAALPIRQAGRPNARPRRRFPLWSPAVALAAMLAAAVYWVVAPFKDAEQLGAVRQDVVEEIIAERVLADHVAMHLQRTRTLLLTATNSDGVALLPSDAFVESLASENRVYAAAADKAGDSSLKVFLMSLDPLLIELAKQPRAADVRQEQGFRDFVHDTDILFQMRVVEARLRSGDSSRARTRVL